MRAALGADGGFTGNVVTQAMHQRRLTACLAGNEAAFFTVAEDSAAAKKREAVDRRLQEWFASTQATRSLTDQVVFECAPLSVKVDARWNQKRATLLSAGAPVIESVPTPCTADARFGVTRASIRPTAGVFESSPVVANADASNWKDRRSSRRSSRVVFESVPIASGADTHWAQQRGTLREAGGAIENNPAQSRADAHWAIRRATIRSSPVASLAAVYSGSSAPTPPTPLASLEEFLAEDDEDTADDPSSASSQAKGEHTQPEPAKEMTKRPEDTPSAALQSQGDPTRLPEQAAVQDFSAKAASTDEQESGEFIVCGECGQRKKSSEGKRDADMGIWYCWTCWEVAGGAAKAGVVEGKPLPRDLRAQVWTERLGASASPVSTSSVTPILRQLLAGIGDDATIDRLSSAFIDKHLSWLAAGEAGSEAFFVALAQALRYHSPWVSAALERVSSEASLDIPSALDTVCNGPLGLVSLLLSPTGAETEEDQQAEKESLLLLCDLVVVEETHKMLLIFVVVVLLSEAPAALEETFEQYQQRVQTEVLSGIGWRGGAGVCGLAEAAFALQEATPLSLSSALALGSLTDSRLELPMCSVDPAEVLHHIYDKPPAAWRLVLIDVRKQMDGNAFPVSLRFDKSQNKFAALEALPYDECIHLCFVADGPPAPGDAAFELAEYLSRTTLWRRHVSVVDGGWGALKKLAEGLNLELTEIEERKVKEETGTVPKPKVVSGFLGRAQAAMGYMASAGTTAKQVASEGYNSAVQMLAKN